jgi:hypothetical protein
MATRGGTPQRNSRMQLTPETMEHEFSRSAIGLDGAPQASNLQRSTTPTRARILPSLPTREEVNAMRAQAPVEETRNAADVSFDTWDTNADGSLDRQEVEHMLQSALGDGAVNDAYTQGVLDSFDIDGDGQIDKAEYSALYQVGPTHGLKTLKLIIRPVLARR